MCHLCIINDVKSKLSRRELLKGAAVTAAAGGLMATSNVMPAMAAEMKRSYSKVMDLTHTLTKDFPTFTGLPAFESEDPFTYEKDQFNLKILKYEEHVGTHFDAPLHFSADGDSIDEIPVEKLVCPLAIIDVRDAAKKDIDYRLTIDDIIAFEAKNGKLEDNACVAMLSGWEEHIGTDMFRGEDSEKALHFPGFHVDAVNFLINERNVNGIAVDTMSLDHGPSADFATHYAWLPSGRYGIENIANLAKLPATGATLIAGAPKFKGGTGGPGRVLALV